MAPLHGTGRSSVLDRRCAPEGQAVDGGGSLTTPREPVAAKGVANGLAALPDISIGEIAAYVAILQCGSFTEAARHLYLSQPGLSARISRLERSLGVVLIDRSTRELSLTRAGVAFAATAHSVLRLLAPSSQVDTQSRKQGSSVGAMTGR